MPKDRTSTLLFTAECLTAVAIGYGVFRLQPAAGLWCLVFIVGVLTPDREEAVALAKNRIIANVIGAAIGLAVFWFPPITFVSVVVAVVSTLAACHVLKLQQVDRLALAAVLITILHAPGEHRWEVAAERALGAVGGCLIGVALAFAFKAIDLRTRNLR